eukprot:3413608-Prymnesium_polylepis.1
MEHCLITPLPSLWTLSRHAGPALLPTICGPRLRHLPMLLLLRPHSWGEPLGRERGTPAACPRRGARGTILWPAWRCTRPPIGRGAKAASTGSRRHPAPGAPTGSRRPTKATQTGRQSCRVAQRVGQRRRSHSAR